jgi:hypothetical protein
VKSLDSIESIAAWPLHLGVIAVDDVLDECLTLIEGISVSSTGVALTDDGEMLLGDARRLLQLEEAARNRLAAPRLSGTPTGLGQVLDSVEVAKKNASLRLPAKKAY